jgi:hypothetical protein
MWGPPPRQQWKAPFRARKKSALTRRKPRRPPPAAHSRLPATSAPRPSNKSKKAATGVISGVKVVVKAPFTQ